MRIFSPHQCQNERGGAIVEFALIASFLLLLLMVTFDYGRIFFTSIGVTSAANGLALFAYQKSVAGAIPIPIDSPDKAKAIAHELSPDVNFAGLLAEVNRSCRCPPATTYTECPTSPPATCRIIMEITTSGNFRTVAKFPGIPNETTINRKAVIRVQ